MSSPTTAYLAALTANVASGDATEHTHRPAFKAFIEALAKDITATNEPKAVQGGAPDFAVMRGNSKLGIIETKDVGVDLDEIEKSEQLTRYRKAFPNLVLTDYLEFRWYVDGKLRLKASLGKREKKKLEIDPQSAPAVEALLRAFLSEERPQPETPEGLARRMADIAVLIRSLIEGSLARGEKGKLHEQLEGFREVLLHDLTEPQFADMYAQTICYGLFAARIFMEGKADTRKFSRVTAQEYLPKTNPFLRKVFSEIAGADLEDGVRWAVDDIAEVLRRAKMNRVLEDFGRRTRQEDPVVHFYETFLAAYDPKMREARGVYYTPEPVVSFIVRSIDHILKTDFGLKDGLADNSKVTLTNEKGEETESHRVLILDPATGTGTFLHGVVDEVHVQVTGKYGGGVWPQYVREHLLPRLFGFELLMAPYAVAHMKLGIQLQELEPPYDFAANERLGVFLTNTLEEARKVSDLLFARWLSDEARAASEIKRERPIMVVLGNPPYSGHSENKGDWIKNLLHGKDSLTHKATGNYFECNGKALGERNPKWLNDDYVKFIRFAQWRIEQTGHGVLAFISNNGYIDNPTFRGMRQSLLETFDDIYVLDLHGNSKKKERAPDGGPDENVFDIMQGVCIGIFVKKPGGQGGATVRHAHLWGLREIKGSDGRATGGKYPWLYGHDVSNTKWKRVKPTAPFHLFVPQDGETRDEYERGWKVTDAMPVNSLGIATARDDFCIDFAREDIVKRVRDFVALDDLERARTKFRLGADVRDWSVRGAQDDVRETGTDSRHFRQILYRPFDSRWTYYTGNSRGFQCMPRREIMQHVLAGANIGLITARSVEIGRGWEHVFCAHTLTQLHTVSLKEVNYHLPLYLYPNGKAHANLFDHENGRRPNFAAKFIDDLTSKLGKLKFVPDGKGDFKKTFGPEDVFHYMYAVFHAPCYRTRYSEFLKTDFPRLPLTSSLKLFRGLCGLGEELVALHLMERDGPRKAMPRFPVNGDNMVEKVAYVEPADEPGRVWINGKQYFEPVPPEVWNFQIGGYQVAEKWLKDRVDRKLGYDELDTYCRIIAALSETMRLMGEIDKLIEQNGGWPIQ
ncbi:MAG: DNA methyltransferase [Planctomycetes bacterium]|nr:DNA methyltransferase [Planctomycetota bacterium]